MAAAAAVEAAPLTDGLRTVGAAGAALSRPGVIRPQPGYKADGPRETGEAPPGLRSRSDGRQIRQPGSVSCRTPSDGQSSGHEPPDRTTLDISCPVRRPRTIVPHSRDTNTADLGRPATVARTTADCAGRRVRRRRQRRRRRAPTRRSTGERGLVRRRARETTARLKPGSHWARHQAKRTRRR